MAKKFDALRTKMSPDVRARATARARAMQLELHLAELRKARSMSQIQVAELLGVAQGEISKIEHRSDLFISTLREYVKAMGGELELVARFPDMEVRIASFDE